MRDYTARFKQPFRNHKKNNARNRAFFIG
jgi:hypothetical protein